jgi:hypothetical protein
MSHWPRVNETLDIIPRYALIAFSGFVGEYNTDYLMDQTETSLMLLNMNLISWAIMLGAIGGFMTNALKIYLSGRKPKPDEENSPAISEPITLNP